MGQDYSLLKAEIAKPEYGQIVPQEGLALDDAIAMEINGKTATISLPLPISSLQAFLDSEAVAAGPAAGVALSLAIEDLADTATGGAVPTPLIYAARMLRRIDVAKYPAIEAAKAPMLRALAEAMAAAGIMSNDQVTALMALFPTQIVPLWQTLGFDGSINGLAVTAARE